MIIKFISAITLISSINKEIFYVQLKGLTNESRRPFAAFDPEGVIFAVASDTELKLYDLRSYDKVCIMLYRLVFT